MSNLTVALPTLILPHFDSARAARLTGAVIPRAELEPTDRVRMYELLANYFHGTSRAQFESDLAEKELVVLLRDSHTSQIQGFSTLMSITTTIDGREIVAFFSGDTIVAHEYWGETILSKLWSQTVFAEADRIRALRPGALVFWFLICSGYKTWRFLPVFFREFYPHPQRLTPPHIKRILDALGERKFGAAYHLEEGVVHFPFATPLREGVADITEQRLRDPMIAFFQRMNPGHLIGDELACLAEISRSNLTRAGERMVGPRMVKDATHG